MGLQHFQFRHYQRFLDFHFPHYHQHHLEKLLQEHLMIVPLLLHFLDFPE
jgi:hypothetical protein